ncbi:MAG: TRAP transporter small permease [Proteobacteria bacterium]|nr:TRAP transporter small permease [Pseudomonadota bacterium]MCH7957062.1 TRAP transporter small permease [Pseudomonadota bacterium]MCH8213929.1 TRAP transporter small permease [Pseudomonadota bacterium]
MTRALIRAIDRNGERYLLLVFYTLVVVVIGVEVIRRFVLSFSSIWGEEIARFAFIYLTWIGASAGVKNRSHIRIDVIYSWVPERHHVWLYILADVATMAFAVVALYYSLIPIITSINFDSVTDGLRINRSFFLVAVPLGFTMTLVRLVQNIRRDLSDHKAGRPIFRGKKLFE